MNKFRPGDKVEKQNADSWNQIQDGHRGTVTSVDGAYKIYVDWDNSALSNQRYYLTDNYIKKVEEDMNRFYVKTCPQLSTILQEIAFDKGYCWFSRNKSVSNTGKNWLSFDVKDRKIRCSGPDYYEKYNFPELEDFTLEEFKHALKNGIKKEPEPIVISGYEVEFYKDHIDVGCTGFDNQDVIDLFHLMERNSIKHVIMESENIKVSLDEIKEIYNRLED